jgi:hypothetical protein
MGEGRFHRGSIGTPNGKKEDDQVVSKHGFDNKTRMGARNGRRVKVPDQVLSTDDGIGPNADRKSLYESV